MRLVDTRVEGRARCTIILRRVNQIAICRLVSSFPLSRPDRRSTSVLESSTTSSDHAQVTPLHFDPTANLFELVDSSSPEAAKHFLLFPPDLQLGGSGQRNTSDLEFNLHDQDQVSGNEDLKDKALVCVLKKGEMLYVPNRWWHRVENVMLDGKKGGWNAGLGFWHMKR